MASLWDKDSSGTPDTDDIGLAGLDGLVWLLVALSLGAVCLISLVAA